MNELQWGFVFHEDRCIQCGGCETACNMWRSTEHGVNWRRVLNIWHGDYPNITCSALSVSCLHCDDPACVGACPSQAITKRASDGLVLVDRDKCTGCQACLRACPYDVPQFGADGLMQKCDMCVSDMNGNLDAASHIPPCIRTCPTGALEIIKMTPAQKTKTENDLSAFYQKAGRGK